MIIRRTVAGQKVRVNALPWPEFEDRWVRWQQHVLDHESGIIGLDVETSAIDELLGAFQPDVFLRMVQFGSLKEGWALDAHDEFWRERIVALLADERFRFVSHTNYDPLWVRREFGIWLDTRWIDTLTMAALVYPGVTERKGLKELCTKHIDPLLAETEAALLARFKKLAPVHHRTDKKAKTWGFTNIALDDEIFATYAGLDAIFVRRLLDVLAALIKKHNMAKLSVREQRIARLATDMRYKGLRVDPDWTRDLFASVEADYMEADNRLRELWGFTPLSPKRADWLTEHGAEFTEFTPTGQPKLTMPSAADPGTLLDLQLRYESDSVLGPIFDDMVTLGSNKNFLSNLTIILASAANDGFVHPEIVTQAAHTGRMSIKKPAMQTLKKRDPRLRGCFIARDGKVLVGADYDSQEIRIAAAYSRDPALLRIVREGLNQHLETAKMIFGADSKTAVMNAVTGQTFYDASKTLDFAQQYGAGPYRIGSQLGYPGTIDPETGRKLAHPEAYKMWRAWREAYAGLVEWTEKIGEAEFIINPWGRRIPADRWRSYASGNYAVQSTGRDILGDAIVRLADAGWGNEIWLPVHDELILEVDEDRADEAKEAMTELMRHKIKDIDLTVTAKILGTRWGSVED